MRLNFTTNIGFILLAVYLILVGISGFLTGFVIPAVLFNVLALLAGVFILIGR